MKISAAVFLLVVGSIWLLFVLWMFLEIAAVAGPPVSIGLVIGYWGAYLAGPVVLICGSGLLLRQPASIPGRVLICLGCLALTGFAIYNSVEGMHRQPLQAPPTYWFYAVLLVIMLLADVAGYKLVQPVVASLLKER